jgi:thioredoxin-related protein
MRRRSGTVSVSTVVLLVVAFACAALVGERVYARSAQDKLATAVVRDITGQRVSLVPKGQPTVVMVSSRTCPWCKKALTDFGRMAKGEPVPGLTLFTLEGAAEGAPMLEKEKLRGARLVGPAGSREEAERLFRYPGTPTFIAFDRNGRVVHTIPGYPIEPELARLFAVMVREADVP